MERRFSGCIRFVFAVIAIAALGSTAAQAQEKRNTHTEDEVRWEGQLAAGKRLTIVGMNGSIRAELAAGDRAEIQARKKAGITGRAEDLSVVIVEHAGGVTACVVPTDDPGRCTAEGRSRGSWPTSWSRNVNVEFLIKVPRGIELHASTVNGGVIGRDLESVVEASTTNGAVRVGTSRFVSASTTNGSVDVQMGSSDWSGTLRLATTNGSIKVELPDDAQFQVEARTTNGRVESDFPITTQGRIRRNRLSGEVGGGGRSLELKTTNGRIELSKGRAAI